MIRSYACADETEWMGVSVDKVDLAAFDIFLEVFSHVEACWTCAYDSEAVSLVRPNQVLTFDSVNKRWVIVSWCEERRLILVARRILSSRELSPSRKLLHYKLVV